MLRSVLGWLGGQAIALAALALSGWALLRNRRKVKVEVSPGVVATPAGEPRSVIDVTVSNLGRAVTVRSPSIRSVPKGVVYSWPVSLRALVPGAQQYDEVLPTYEPGGALTRRLDTGESATWLLEVSVEDRPDRETLSLFASVHVVGGRTARSKRFRPHHF